MLNWKRLLGKRSSQEFGIEAGSQLASRNMCSSWWSTSFSFSFGILFEKQIPWVSRFLATNTVLEEAFWLGASGRPAENEHWKRKTLPSALTGEWRRYRMPGVDYGLDWKDQGDSQMIESKDIWRREGLRTGPLKRSLLVLSNCNHYSRQQPMSG